MIEIPISPNTKGLIFDIDGTLVDTMSLHYKASQIACNEYGFDFPLDFFKAYAGVPTLTVFELLIKHLGLNFNGREIGLKKENLYLELVHEVKPLQPVYDIVLKYEGKLPIALGTGATREIAEMTLKAAGILDKFEHIVTCDDVTNPKPAPDTFLQCASLIGIQPKYCQVFEDGDAGIKAAIDGGMMATDIRQYVDVNIQL
ncbi:HAD family hydrolase [Sporocytophaga myxococcoides]|uniref:HAD family hydrolase n=1 Tax=Sporocytophaga myxococcoides TaxID=153721 RepID=UPI0004090401|nr:HAD-IA family hydrolase [Sporocytophaga myxococcoides]